MNAFCSVWLSENSGGENIPVISQSNAQLFNVSRHQIQGSSQWNKDRQAIDISEHDEIRIVPTAKITDADSLCGQQIHTKDISFTMGMRHPCRADIHDNDEAHLVSFGFCF